MKQIQILFTLLLATTALTAQSFDNAKGDLRIHASLGVVPTYFMDRAEVNFLPTSVGVDYYLSEIFSLGLQGGYSASTSQAIALADKSLVQYENQTMMLGMRAAMHSTAFERVVVYGGGMLGYHLPIVNEVAIAGGATPEPVNPNGPSQTQPYRVPPATGKLVYTGFVGVSYRATTRLSGSLEAGFGVSILQVGLNYKL